MVYYRFLDGIVHLVAAYRYTGANTNGLYSDAAFRANRFPCRVVVVVRREAEAGPV